MQPIQRALVAACAIAATSTVAAPVQAGDISPTGSFDAVVVVEGVGSADVLDGLTLELFVDGGSGPGAEILATPAASCTIDPPESGVAYTEQFSSCVVPSGDYIIGLDGVPDGFDVEVDCFGSVPAEALVDEPDAFITVFPGSTVDCGIYVIQPASLGVAVFAPSFDPAFFDTMTVEAFTDPGGVQVLTEPDCRSEQGVADESAAYLLVECDMVAGDYVLGLDGVPDAVTDLFGFCDGFVDEREQLDPIEFSFSVFDGEIAECDVYLELEPQLLVDLVVAGGDHLPTAPIEVYDDGGALVAELVDSAAASCTTPDEESPFELLSDCAVGALPAGTYDFGVTLPEYGYVLDGPVTCEPFITRGILLEILPDGTGTFSHGAPFGGEGPEQSTRCEIPVRYVEQLVTADVVVVNDDGDGASDGSDITIEIYDSSNALVDSGVDPEPGTGNASAEFVLPVGAYTFGVAGADGYDVSVVVSPIEIPLTEIIDDPSAAFSLDPTTAAEAVVTADDIATTTTTTLAPTTTATPTTAAPTTASPATTVDPSSGAAVPTTATPTVAPVLPATGGESGTSLRLALIAFALLALGGGAVAVTRRS